MIKQPSEDNLPTLQMLTSPKEQNSSFQPRLDSEPDNTDNQAKQTDESRLGGKNQKPKKKLLDKIDQNANVEKLELQTISREIYLKGRLIKYSGPNHPRIQELLDILEDRAELTTDNPTLIKIRQFFESVNNFFKRNCSFKDGFIQITIHDVIVFIAYTTIYLVFLFEAIELVDDSQVKQNQYNLIICKNLPIFGATLFVYKVMYMEVSNPLIHVLLFLAVAILPGLLIYVLINDITNTSQFTLFVTLLFVIGMHIFSLIANRLYLWVKEQFSQIHVTSLKVIICLLAPYFLLFQSFKTVVTARETSTLTQKLTGLLFIPFIFVFLLAWILIHYRLLELPISLLTLTISTLKERLNKLELKPTQEQHKKSSWFTVNLNRIVSFLIGGIFVGYESYLFTLFVDTFSQYKIDQNLQYTILIEIIGLPVFMIVGIYISVSDRKRADTFLYVPLVFAIGFSFGLMYLDSYLSNQYKLLNSLSMLLIYGPFFTSVIWLTTTLFGIEQRQLYLITLAFLFIFLVLPIGLLYPLYQTNQEAILLYLAIVLLILGGTIAITAIFLRIFIKVNEYSNYKTRENKFNFGSLAYVSLVDLAYWVNSVFFLLAFSLLSYFFWNTPAQGDDVIGSLYALLIIHPILFVLTNICLRGFSLEEVRMEDEEKNNPLYVLEKRDNENQIKQQKLLKEYQTKIYQIGFAGPLIVFSILSTLQSNRKYEIFYRALSIGIPLCFLVFRSYLYIKNRSRKFQYFLQPVAVITLWLLIFFPFGTCAPIISIYLNHYTDTFNLYFQITILCGLIIFVIGVTFVVIFLQILLDRENEEKQLQFITSKVIETFIEGAVLAEANITFPICKQFQEKGEEKLKEDLLSYELVGIEPYEGEDRRCDHRLIQGARYFKLKQLAQQEEEKKQKEKQEQERKAKQNKEQQLKQQQQQKQEQSSCLQSFLKILYCRYGIELEDEMAKRIQEEIINLTTIQEVISEPEIQNRLADMLPELKSAVVDSMVAEQNLLDLQFTGLFERLEMDAEFRLMKHANDQTKIDLFDVTSSQTQELQSIIQLPPDARIYKRFQMSEFGQCLKRYRTNMAEFMNDIFLFFANVDEGYEPTIIYKDFLEFLRLGGYEIVDDERSPLSQNFKVQVQPESIQRFYNQVAGVAWLHQSVSMNEFQFVQILILLNDDGLNDDDAFDNLAEVVYGVIFPNLAHNIRSIGLSVKQNNRSLMQNFKSFNYEASPFNEAQFKSLLGLKKQTDLTAKLHKQDQKLMLLDDQRVYPEGSTASVEIKFSPKNILNNREQQIAEIQEKHRNRISCCRKCMISCCNCLNTLFWVYPARFQKWVGEFVFGENTNKPADNAPKIVKPTTIAVSNVQRRRKMKSWNMVVDEVLKTIKVAKQEYDLHQKVEEQLFQFNFANILAVTSRILEYKFMVSLAFTLDIDWFNTKYDNSQAELETSTSVTDNAYVQLFYFYFAMTMIYLILGVRAAKHSKDNTLGLDEKGNKAQFPHFQFFLPRIIQLIGGQLSGPVLSSYLTAFVCDFKVKPYLLQYNNQIVCLSDQHYSLMGLSILGVSTYYPLLSFLQPQFQFSDKTLALKYNPNFIVIYTQFRFLLHVVKYLFTGFTFGGSGVSNTIQLLLYFFILVSITAIYSNMMPCQIKWYNKFEILIFIAILGLYIGGLVITLTGYIIIGWVITGTIILIVLVLIGVLLWDSREILYKKKVQIFVIDGDLPCNKIFLQKEIQVKDHKKMNAQDILDMGREENQQLQQLRMEEAEEKRNQLKQKIQQFDSEKDRTINLDNNSRLHRQFQNQID